MTANITLPSVTPLAIGEATVNSVDGRKIHEYLGIATPYPTWVRRRIAEVGLIEDRDFAVFSHIPDLESGNRGARTEYVFSIRAAKHLCMVEKNERGYTLREYFLDVEERALSQARDPMALLSDPNVLRGLLGGYAERVIALEAEVQIQDATINHLESEVEEQNYVIESMEPKAEFYDNFVEADGLHTLTHVARELGQRPHAFTQALRDKKILTKDRKFNVPCAKAINAGYMLVRPHVITRKSGITESIPQTLVTSRGIAWLGKLLTSGKLDSCPQTH